MKEGHWEEENVFLIRGKVLYEQEYFRNRKQLFNFLNSLGNIKNLFAVGRDPFKKEFLISYGSNEETLKALESIKSFPFLRNFLKLKIVTFKSLKEKVGEYTSFY